MFELRHNRSGNKALRRATGGSLAELGPALWLLFLGLFFPILGILSMIFSYAAIMVLNDLQVQEAALIPSKDALSIVGPVRYSIPKKWLDSGMGAFVKPMEFPRTTITYAPAAKDGNGVQDYYVIVKTICRVRPMVSVSFMPDVPAVTTPFKYSLESKRLMENYKNAPKQSEQK